MMILTAAFIIVWGVAQWVQSKLLAFNLVDVKTSDVDKACTEAKEEWVKQFQKMYPTSICPRTLGGAMSWP